MLLDQLQPAPADAILALIDAFRNDPRDDKIDLGVGVYRDSSGRTPIMAAVHEAESRLLASQSTKTYVGMAGDAAYNSAVAALVFGDSVPAGRVGAVQAPGGCGALRLLADLVKLARPDARVFVSEPTWPNHIPILRAAGLEVETYPYLDRRTMLVDAGAMVEGLARAGAGDVVLLHGCCHNPSGADLDGEGWQAVTDLALERGFLPFVDLAYQGFGNGLDADAGGLRRLAAAVPEMLVASSCSKNFGIYRERAGCAMVLTPSTEQTAAPRSRLMSIARGAYSMPPDHGAAVVAMILGDAALRKSWQTELDGMRGRMQGLRVGLTAALRERTGDDRFGYLEKHVGMFSLLGTTEEQVARLREQHAVYAVGAGRINIAGLTEAQIDRFADALVAVTR